ncbi:MAG: penicillin-binding protein activator [Alphaproteobacteria bacterium]|jgi:branched-chain amino acid transport system substrate-binding protein|nr:penicillin-binding protein activator [Alphaproteobacteria bacterium]
MSCLGLLTALSLSGCSKRLRQEPAPVQDPLRKKEDSLSKAGSKREVPFRVALLLPLSGPHSKLGKSMLKAAELSLFESEGQNVEFSPHDTKGSVEGAKAAVQTALKKQPDLILGPLLSDQVKAVTPLAWGSGVPVLSFSNDTSVAGDNVFVMGHPPREQTEQILNYALEQKLFRYVIVAPTNTYGDTVVKTVKDILRENPTARLNEVISYEGDVNTIKNKLASLDLREIDAILIPEGGYALTQIVKYIATESTDPHRGSIRSVRLLGTSQWDEDALLRDPHLYGAWFVAPPLKKRRAFEETYKANYKEAPLRLANLSYDGIHISKKLAEQENQSVSETLTQIQGFSGLDGRLKFDAEGIPKRELAIIEITPTGFHELSVSRDNQEINLLNPDLLFSFQ